MRLIVLVAASLIAASGCGGVQQQAQTPAGRPPLPGTALPPNSLDASPEMERTARRILSVEEGGNSFALIAAWSEQGRLCLADEIAAADPDGGSAMSPFDCFGPDGEVLRPYVAFGGSALSGVDWAALLGLARPEVARVFVELEGGRAREARVVRWPGFDWVGFSYGIVGRPLPRSVVAYAGDGELLRRVEVAAHIEAYCPGGYDDPCEPELPERGRPWADSRNALETPEPQLTTEDAERTKEIVAHDPLVQRLLASRKYHYEAVGLFFGCDDERIGTFAEIKLAEPATFEGNWPYVAFPKGYGSYTQGIVHFRIANANQLDLLIDFRGGAVIGVEPTNFDLDLDAEARVSNYRVVRKAPGEGQNEDEC